MVSNSSIPVFKPQYHEKEKKKGEKGNGKL
jgi:hypothetical protein